MTLIRLSQPVNLQEARDIIDYLNALVRDLEGAFLSIGGDFDVAQNRQSMASQSLSETGNIGQGSSVVLCDASASAITVSLPDPLEVTGRVYHVKKINTNTNDVTVDCQTGGVTIDSSANQILTGSSKPSIMCYSDGREYWII